MVIRVVATLPFACGDTLTDIRDNRSYPTVLVGAQCWLAANLDYGTLTNGLGNQRDNCIPEKFCTGNMQSNCTLNGGLYQWDEVMAYQNTASVQGMCPPGWHVPSEGDWNVVFAFYTNNAFAGAPLLFTGYSGFNAKVVGNRFNNTSWNFGNFATIFWSSTAHGPKKAWAHGMNVFNKSVSFYPSNRNHGMSVRCLKD